MKNSDIKIHRVSEGGKEMFTSFLPGSKTIVTSELNVNAGAKPVPLEYDHEEEQENSSLKYYPWGTDNLWPTKARKKLENSTTALPLIYNAVALMFGSGITYYREVKDGSKISYEFPEISEIDEFLDQNNIEVFLLEQLMDFKFNGNIFGEFILSESKEKIVNVYHKEAEFSRLKRMEKDDTYIKQLYYSGEWTLGEPVNLETVVKIDLINPRNSSKDEIKKISSSKKKCAYHFYFPSPGRTQYGLPPHAGLFRKDGWLDYSNDIPLILNAINKNQISIKYHIKIPISYWQSMYKDWDTMPQAKRDQLIKTKLEEMDTWLTDNSNQGKSFVSHFHTDAVTGKEVAGWSIEAIDDKQKKDAYIPTTEQADIQIARALRIDPSMAGIQAQGGKLGAGSGSDKRQGFNNSVSLTKAEQTILFQPLRIIAKFNGWDPKIKFAFKHEQMETLDVNPTGKSTTL